MKKILYALFIIATIQGCKKDQPILKTTNLLPGKRSSSAAVFSLSGALQSNMVVQRDKPFKLWGTAIAGHTITVKTSWNSSTFSAVSNSTNDWLVTIPATPVNTIPQTIQIKDNNVVVAEMGNILIGDVWVCSGQSNMVMPMDSLAGFGGFEGVVDFHQEIAAANWPNIRLFNTDLDTQPISKPPADFKASPSNDVPNPSTWMVCNPVNAKKYSGIAYYFGRALNYNLKVPIGLVVTAVRGTTGECWVSMPTLKSTPLLTSYYSGHTNASKLYNGMIYPIRNLSVKGFIWDQGEENRNDNPLSNYGWLSYALINNWRETFNQGTLPFYYVQMTPYSTDYFSTNPWGSSTKITFSLFREVQGAIRAVPKTGMAVTADIDDLLRLHPRNKKLIGERLAMLALQNDYKAPINAVGPQFKNAVYNGGNKITLNFINADGLNSGGKPVNQWFYLANADKVFYKAVAVISGNTVVITIPSNMTNVKTIRYAFVDVAIGNIKNGAGLAMEPFRTDTW